MNKNIFVIVCICALSVVSCGTKKDASTTPESLTSANPSAYITDSAKYEMIHSLKSIDGQRFLEMDYTLDYKLDELLEYDAATYEKFMEFVATHLLDVVPEKPFGLRMSAGCSAFAAENAETGDRMMGRNYDYCHVENGQEVPITAILVRTAPKNGKKSINMIDSYWLGYHYGFYNDGKSDLSALMAAPYTVLDGMNEDGLAVCILHLGGNPTAQVDTTKKSLWGSVLIRYMLDKASSVDEAIELARNINLNMVTLAKGNNHFFLADASGNYAILEYTYNENEKITKESTPNRMLVLNGEDHSYVTNFYVDPFLADNEEFGGKAIRGKARYLILQGTLMLNTYKLSKEQAHDLLKSVSQTVNPTENTSHTQWSALYNLTQRTMDISLLREYKKVYSFKLE